MFNNPAGQRRSRSFTPSHSRQTSRSGNGYDDQDEIVGSYLSRDFLDQWAGVPTSTSSELPSSSLPSQSKQPLAHSGGYSMASSSTIPQAHATGQVPASTRTVRKSTSGHRLKAKISMSNMANPTPTTLPDPSLFPDPYPSGYNAATTSVTPPVSLFSAGSSSARSSAYTSASPASALRSSVASSDSAHNARHLQHQPPHLPSPTRTSQGEGLMAGFHSFLDNPNTDSIHHHFAYPSLDSPSPHQVGVASTADESVQLRDMDQLPSAVTARPNFGSRPGSRPVTLSNDDPSQQTRWSSSSAASQGSSWGNFDTNDPSLRRSGAGAGGNEDGNGYRWTQGAAEDRDEEYYEEENHEEDDIEPTAAVLLAEQGHGEIVNGAGKDINELHIPMNTTHLLLGQVTSTSILPGFLSTLLPSISHSLLALDISANFLTALPPPLAACRNLEELNIGSNPLRILPTWLAVLTNLRVLIADSIGISTIPGALSGMIQLHTLSIRNNKMYSLPSWLCLLPLLETLYLDGNPFQGPWKALVEPLITRVPNTPARSLYPPNTPRTMNSIESTDQSEYSEEKNNDTVRGTNSSAMSMRPGHRPTSSRDLNLPNNAAPPVGERPSTAGGRMRAVTLDRDSEHLRGPQQRVRTVQNPESPRPHTSFGTHTQSDSRSLSRTKTAPSRRPSTSATSIASQLVPPDGATSRMGWESPASMSTRMTDTPSGERDDLSDRAQSPNTVRKMKSTGDVKLAAMNAAANAGGVGSSRPDTSLPNDMGAAESNPGLGKFMSVGARGPMKEEYRALTATMFETPSTPITSQTQAQAQSNRGGGGGKEKKWGFFKKMSKSRLRSGSTAGDDEAYTAIVSQPLGPPRTMGGMGGPSDANPIAPPHSSAGSITPGTERPPMLTASHVGFRSSTNLGQMSPPRRVLSKRPADATHHNSISANMISGPMPSGTPSGSSSMFTKSTTSLSSQPSTPGFLAPPQASPTNLTTPTSRKAKRRSFLPILSTGPLLDTNIVAVDGNDTGSEYGNRESNGFLASPLPISPIFDLEEKQRERHQRALRSVMGYLRDMCDLSAGTSTGATTVAAAAAAAQAQVNANPNFSQVPHHHEPGPGSRSGPPSRSASRRPTLATADTSRVMSEFSSSGGPSMSTYSNPTSMFSNGSAPSFGALSDALALANKEAVSPLESDTGTIVDAPPEEKKVVKDDKNKRSYVVKEIVSSERTYVKLLQELVDIYVKPAAAPVTNVTGVQTKETVVPASERKIVFNELESLLGFHKGSLLPLLEKASQTLESADDSDGKASAEAALKVAQVFMSHAAFLRMYSTYINNFDNAMRRTKQWSEKNLAAAVVSASSSGSNIAGGSAAAEANSHANLTPAQRKRIKAYLKRCRANPRHSQMNMESYLLLPVQRIPRYRLLFEDLVRATPPTPGLPENVIQRALDEISALASNMNEGKREAESRRKLVQWQGRIRGKFPSPLVQPHRRLIMDGRLQLTRVVRKIADYFEVVSANGEKALVSVECLAPEVTPRALTAILCNDLLVLCKDPSQGKDPSGPVDLWAVLRMQTVSQPASIMHGSALRLVDNKAILYFDLPAPTEALTWSRAINMHIPASTK